MSKQRKQPIEPKPTRYGGVDFRSRLEARWAVFLDFVPNVINWEFEPKTFKLPNGWTYTPDFSVKLFVPGKQLTCYLEVKPLDITDSYRDFLKAMVDKHKFVLHVLCGDFYNDDHMACYTITYKKEDYVLPQVLVGWNRAHYTAKHFRFDLES